MNAILILSMSVLLGFGVYVWLVRKPGRHGCWYWGHEWDTESTCTRCGHSAVDVHTHGPAVGE